MTSAKEESWQLRTIEIVTLQLKRSVERLVKFQSVVPLGDFPVGFRKYVRKERFPRHLLKMQTNPSARKGCHSLLWLRVAVVFLSRASQT